MKTEFYNDGVIITSLVTLDIGCFVVSLKLMFKSKSKQRREYLLWSTQYKKTG